MSEREPAREDARDTARDPASARTLWHGRFGEGPSDELLAFTVSLPFDRRLAEVDIAGSRAHVTMLTRQGLLDNDDRAAIVAALDAVRDELREGRFEFVATDEDIHTAIERRVTEIAGDAGGKIHTGRSRNDQVATDLRLWLREAGRDQIARIIELQSVLLRRAHEAGDTYLPGYTHLQRAQPVLLAHHFLAHFWGFGRDVDRWFDCLKRADVSPLGAGALAGSSLPLDPAFTAQQLGFAATFENSIDAVADRDFVAEALFCATMTQLHLSRVGEEVVLWTTEEFGFMRLADGYATGSSMLPQKKNPDIAELARGKAGRLIGDLTGLLATLKGLPLSYNRDLQEDKEPLFDALDTCALTLRAVAGLIDTATFLPQRMADAADSPTNAATDLAEVLVRSGTPFREAHALVGSLVRQSIERGVGLDELVRADPRLGPDTAALFDPGAGVRRRSSPGGAGAEPVADQLRLATERLEGERARLDAR